MGQLLMQLLQQGAGQQGGGSPTAPSGAPQGGTAGTPGSPPPQFDPSQLLSMLSASNLGMGGPFMRAGGSTLGMLPMLLQHLMPVLLMRIQQQQAPGHGAATAPGGVGGGPERHTGPVMRSPGGTVPSRRVPLPPGPMSHWMEAS